MDRRLYAIGVLLLVGCASLRPGNTALLPASLRATAHGAKEVEVVGAPDTVKRSLSRVLAARGFVLDQSPEPSVLQASGRTIEDGEVSVRVSFLLTPSGATGRAWWKRAGGPVAQTVRRMGVPLSDSYYEVAWGESLYGDAAFAELAAIADAVPDATVRVLGSTR